MSFSRGALRQQISLYAKSDVKIRTVVGLHHCGIERKACSDADFLRHPINDSQTAPLFCLDEGVAQPNSRTENKFLLQG